MGTNAYSSEKYECNILSGFVLFYVSTGRILHAHYSTCTLFIQKVAVIMHHTFPGNNESYRLLVRFFPNLLKEPRLICSSGETYNCERQIVRISGNLIKCPGTKYVAYTLSKEW